MAVTNIPNVQNWTVTPQNGQSGYFDLMNTWLGQSTLVIASLQSAITAQNAANIEINNLASQAENNAIIATGLANYQGEYSTLTTYSKGQSTSVAGLYYTSKVDGNSNHLVTDSNYWIANPINDKYGKSNIIGIVSQTAGVPTGAIIETGSNANGRYIKFADGTMICTSIVSMPLTGWINSNYGFYYSPEVIKTLPATFIAVPTVSGANADGSVNASGSFITYLESSTTNAIIRCARVSSLNSSSHTVSITVIGRWF